MKSLFRSLVLAGTLFFYSSNKAQVGINTTTPDSNSALDIRSSDKGFLPPRVALTAESNPSPLTAHVAGMVVYNTVTVGTLIPGLYLNDGTKWQQLSTFSNNNGTVTTKVKYRGRNLDTNGYNKPTLQVPTMNLEFRFATTAGDTYLEVRLLSAPSGNVTYYANELWFGTTTNGDIESVTFTPANWNVWSRDISNGRWNNPWGYQYQISTRDGVVPGSNDLLTGNFYGFNNFNNGAGANNEMYVLAFEQY
ncbi:hypothetical protein [Chryseobacterium hispalense]|jgi:hypothetical protein|uniref:hypothetical protein n=1 Tax=Chryseobacterium hispalense TaxID=1453492 RepID=UPI000690B605|nr:hypothetical protein [Chryseobacterium hispalense]MDR6159281.1 hypothetical protein [Chryseobacterium sp. SLBN-27]